MKYLLTILLLLISSTIIAEPYKGKYPSWPPRNSIGQPLSPGAIQRKYGYPNTPIYSGPRYHSWSGVSYKPVWSNNSGWGMKRIPPK